MFELPLNLCHYSGSPFSLLSLCPLAPRFCSSQLLFLLFGYCMVLHGIAALLCTTMHFVHDSDDYKWAATCHHACINLVLHFANRRCTSPWLFGNLGCCNMLLIFFKILTAAVSSELQILCAAQVCQKRRTRRRCSMLQQTSHPWNWGYAILPY